MNVVHAVRHGLAFGFVREVMRIRLARPTFRFVLAAHIALVSQRFLLFSVDGQSRFATPCSRLHASVDVFKLGIAVGVLLSFLHLAVGLQAIAPFRKQAANR